MGAKLLSVVAIGLTLTILGTAHLLLNQNIQRNNLKSKWPQEEPFTWNYCPNGEQSFKIFNFELNPPKITIGVPIKAQISISSEKELQIKSTGMKIKFGFITIPAGVYDLEKIINIPIGKSIQSLNFNLPPMAIPGRYEGVIELISSQGKTVECLVGKFQVTK